MMGESRIVAALLTSAGAEDKQRVATLHVDKNDETTDDMTNCDQKQNPVIIQQESETNSQDVDQNRKDEKISSPKKGIWTKYSEKLEKLQEFMSRARVLAHPEPHLVRPTRAINYREDKCSLERMGMRDE
ncbi:hypothetical protein WDU94_001269 [Cyamophila willieti]